MKALSIAGLDVGSATTCAVVVEGEPGEGRPATVLGVGQARTHGLRGDSVIDLAAMTESIRTALSEAEQTAGRRVRSVYAGIGGHHIETLPSLGVSVILDSEVTETDLDRCHEVAQAVVLPPEREMLHVIPQEYRVDHQEGIARPTGMTGVRLECDAFVVTSSAQANANLRRAVRHAGYGIAGLVLEPLAAARSVLADEEKEVGVAVVDIGGASTSIAAFREGRLEHVSVLPFGGEALTTDLMRGLSVSYAEARRAKERYSTALASMVDPHETVDMPGPSPGQTRPVARELISHVVEQRLVELLSHVEQDLERGAPLDALAAGVVVCGGTASMPGTLELAEGAFACPVRIGAPGESLTSSAGGIVHPKFATAAGLALWGHDLAAAGGGRTNRFALPSKIIAWLKDFF